MANESISRTTFVKGLTAGVVVAASLGILNAGEYSINGLPTIGEGSGSYTPGTYTASVPGISSDITVTCTFNETTITSIEADVSGETPGIGADIGDLMVGKVLENQIAEVDGESGATITSDAFKAAVANCIAQASGETVAAPAGETEAAAETVVTAPEEAADDAEAASAPVASAGAVSYVPGEYTANAKGISSDVVVTATFDENGITNITTDVSGETPGIGADIADDIIAKAMNAQSAEIDGIASATITSDAFKAALADCIAQASGDAATAQEAETAAVTEAAAEVETVAASETEALSETEGTSEAQAAVAAGSYVPGEYTAKAKGISSDVVVTAAFDENGITNITTDVSGETPGIGADIADDIIAKAMDAQSAEIDGIASATITSDAFKAALADCIAQAYGGAATAEEIETAAVTEAAAEVETVAASETEALSETEGTSEAQAAVAAGSYVPGEYTAKAKGISSDVVVTAAFDENGITNITTDVSGETPGIGGNIADDIIAKAMDAQTAEIEGISGATVTSNAFKAALADCITQASGGSAAAEEAETEEVTEASAEASAEAETSSETEGVIETEITSEKDTNTETEGTSEAVAAGSYVPGEYTSKAKGISSDVIVTATFDENGITDITVDVSGETPGIGAEIGEKMIEEALKAQSAEIGWITGATISSDAFKAALADAIAQAGGDISDETEELSEAETENMTETAAETEIQTETESQTEIMTEIDTEAETETEAVTETEYPYLYKGVPDESLQAADAPFVPGTYTAVGTGISSEITVEVTFDEAKIVSVVADVSGETPSIGAMIAEDIEEQFLIAQCAEIDGISGATITSEAVKEAVADCIAQARAGAEVESESETVDETEIIETESDI